MQMTEDLSAVVSTLANIRLSRWKIWQRRPIPSAVIIQFLNPEHQTFRLPDDPNQTVGGLNQV